MKTRDDRTIAEIKIHISKARKASEIAMVFALDEYCCLICNIYFRKQIFQSDLAFIEDIIVYFSLVGSKQNEFTLKQILITTENLSKKTDGLFLKKEFKQVLPDDLKNKLRSLHNTKSTVNSRFHGDDNFYAKYARDLDTNWVRNIDRFVSLGLIKKSRILDIGCGFGLFSHIAEFNGHKVDSVDMANASPILKKATKLLNIKKHEFTVKKNTPLLKFKYKFDVVSAFQIFFNGHASKDLWDVDEWKFFLMDLHDNILNDNGVVTLVFNGEHRNLEPIIVNGETLFLGKKSLEEFFKPFFVALTRMARTDNKMIAVLTKKNIKDACKSSIFKKRSYTL